MRVVIKKDTYDFNPRSPHGERQNSWLFYPRNNGFQSTLPAWGATIHPAAAAVQVEISIHAPRMGSDQMEQITLL